MTCVEIFLNLKNFLIALEHVINHLTANTSNNRNEDKTIDDKNGVGK
jgi:hypothetical protein